MISRFTNLFKKSDLDEQRAFQARCVRILSDLYSDKTFEAAEDPLTLKVGESTLGLTNVRARFLLGTQTEAELREIIREHFDKVFGALPIAEREGMSWEQAKLQLMPQLMPAEFLSKLPLASFEFGDQVLLGFVLDTEHAYSYVTEKELDQWAISKELLRETAFENLKERSNGIEMMAIPGDNAFVIVSTMDGFDAARIVVPEMQQYFKETIGGSFYFGVPNRDFLICWSKSGDKKFQADMRAQVSSDFDDRPYPLSGRAFEITDDGIRPETSVDEPTPPVFSNN